MNRYKRPGWFGESYRHYLASKGVKTSSSIPNNYFVYQRAAAEASRARRMAEYRHDVSGFEDIFADVASSRKPIAVQELERLRDAYLREQKLTAAGKYAPNLQQQQLALEAYRDDTPLTTEQEFLQQQVVEELGRKPVVQTVAVKDLFSVDAKLRQELSKLQEEASRYSDDLDSEFPSDLQRTLSLVQRARKESLEQALINIQKSIVTVNRKREKVRKVIDKPSLLNTRAYSDIVEMIKRSETYDSFDWESMYEAQ